MSRSVALAAMCFLALLVPACTDDPAGPEDEFTVEITAATQVLDRLGDSVQLTATLLRDGVPVTGSEPPAIAPALPPIWTSQSPSIVSVDPLGLATAVGPGTAEIRVLVSPGNSGSIEISVQTSAITGTLTLPSTVFENPLLIDPPPPSASSTEAQIERVDFERTIKSQELLVTFGGTALPAELRAGPVEDIARAELAASSLRQQATAAVQGLDAEVRGISPIIRTVRLALGPDENMSDAIERLSLTPGVVHVELNGVAVGHNMDLEEPSRAPVVVGDSPVPSDGFYPFQAWNHGLIELGEAWRISTGSSGVLVAVLDDGIRFDHADIAPQLTDDGYDFVSAEALPICDGGFTDLGGDGDGYDPDPTITRSEGWSSGNLCVTGERNVGGHGLHVAGILGATTNNVLGVAGVNWDVRIRPVKVLGTIQQGLFYDIAQGVLYAAGLPADDGNGGLVQVAEPARVINMSLGGTGQSQALQDAVTAATQAGTLIVASVGNNNNSVPQIPANFPEVIGVSAIAPGGRRASYSNFGTAVAIAAPGGEMSSSFQSGVSSLGWNFFFNLPVFKRVIQGTSMAAPHVAGVAALILSQEPGLTPEQLRQRLLDNAIDLGQPGVDNVYGAGLVNARLVMSNGVQTAVETVVQAYDADTGEIVDSQIIPSGGSYQLSGFDAGTYYLYSGFTRIGDMMPGEPRLRWAAVGSASNPTELEVGEATNVTANIAWSQPPFEQEPNNTQAQASKLVGGGYLYARLLETPEDTEDYFEFRAPVAGVYRFETQGWIGACGLTIEADTVLEILDEAGSVIATHDDIDGAVNLFCSEIEVQLSPGTYFLRVFTIPGKPVFGDDEGGRYIIRSILPGS